ncbi:MAG: hypothetical protein NT148_00745 [Candidatus Nealsonbacteria bacterium]|nr:hypothetical protein [Candidatus Nealsonbacteria bacterium]
MPEKFESEKPQESGPEKILKDLEYAIENRLEVLLTISSLDGKSSGEGVVAPEFFEGDVLWVTTESGEGMALEVSRIKKVELPDTDDVSSPESITKKCPFCKTELVGGSYCPQCKIKTEI